MNQQQNNSGGVGFLGLLTLLFIGLKLTGVIGWSWWWVLSPMLIPLAIVGVILALVFILSVVIGTRKRR